MSILFIVLGIVPVPNLSNVGEASAETLPLLDQADSSGAPSECVYSDWSPCSVDCGGGTQKRELVSGSEGACIDLIQSCNTHSCCDSAGCPTECGFKGDAAYPDGCGETLDCPPTEPCDGEIWCAETDAKCSENLPCCSANDKCSSAGICEIREGDLALDEGCSIKGQKCGGEYGTCCEGLVCWNGNGESRCRMPVDCEGFWGDCVGDECGKEGIRFFHVTKWPSFDGEPCPDPIWQSCQMDLCPGDCQGHWSECEGECGTGVRTYIVDVPAREGGKPCPYRNGAQEECSDLPPCPVDCEGGWGECQGECGTGSRTFEIYSPALYGGAKCEYESGFTEKCDLDPCKIDCRGEWGQCEGGCGGVTGVQTFTVLDPAQAGGTECEAEDGQVTECQTDPCPIDCKGEWNADCIGACDTNDVATYTIFVEAQWGGAECAYQEGEIRQCLSPDCTIQTSADSGAIPVTGSGGSNGKFIRNPFMGTDFGSKLAGFQRFSLHIGMIFFGITMVLEGVTRKYDFLSD